MRTTHPSAAAWRRHRVEILRAKGLQSVFKVSARGLLCSKDSGCKRCADAAKTAGIPRGIAWSFAAGLGNAADAVFAGVVQQTQRTREETLNTLLVQLPVDRLCEDM